MNRQLFTTTYIVLFLLGLCMEWNSVSAQHGDPVYSHLKMEAIDTTVQKGLTTIVYYFPIASNMSDSERVACNKDSMVMESCYIRFAREMPSYRFEVSTRKGVEYTLVLIPETTSDRGKYHYIIQDRKGNLITTTSSLYGSITEGRVDELIDAGYDPAARKGQIAGTRKHQFFFDGILYGYLPYDLLIQEVNYIVRKLK